MAARSNIEWTDSTFNPWEGCQKVGPGCDHCYAENRNARFAGGHAINWGPGAPRRRTSVSNWNLPRRWNARPFYECTHCGWRGEKPATLSGMPICQACEHPGIKAARRRVFCASLADVLDNAVPDLWADDLWDLIDETPKLDWLLTTKRIGNARTRLPARWLKPGCWPAHVRLIITVVTQEEADRDIPKLLALGCPNGLSMEPLLGLVDIGLQCKNWSDDIVMDPETGAYECCKACGYTGIGNDIHWVICGGESGPGARPMHPDWVRSLRDQCEAAGTPFLFKQWGEHAPARTSGPPLESDVQRLGDHPVWVGKKAAGRLLDGRTHDGFPPA